MKLRFPARAFLTHNQPRSNPLAHERQVIKFEVIAQVTLVSVYWHSTGPFRNYQRKIPAKMATPTLKVNISAAGGSPQALKVCIAAAAYSIPVQFSKGLWSFVLLFIHVD